MPPYVIVNSTSIIRINPVMGKSKLWQAAQRAGGGARPARMTELKFFPEEQAEGRYMLPAG